MLNQPKDYFSYFLLSCVLMLGYSFFQGTTVLYLIAKFHFTAASSYKINGTFSALVYFSSVFSGYLLNRHIKANTGIIVGCIIFIASLLLITTNNKNFYYLGLTGISLGYGFIYTNMFYLIGKLYDIKDKRREGGFTLAYMGFNIGSLLGFGTGGFALEKSNYKIVLLLISITFFVYLIFFLKKHIKVYKMSLKTIIKNMLFYCILHQHFMEYIKMVIRIKLAINSGRTDLDFIHILYWV